MIPPAIHEFLTIDLMPMAACVLAAVCCGVLGNFLVLRGMSLMGDAISHSVLPGLVLAFLLTGTRATWPMLVGAGLSGLVTVGLVGLVRRLGRLEPGAAMGVVFSILFALGVVMIERVARQVDLDPECVLYGSAESLFWLGVPRRWDALLGGESLAGVPRQVWTLLGMAAVAIAFVVLLFKELRIACFDPATATSLGFRASWIHTGLMAMVAAATVASFEAVGSILVIAMLVCPAATARLLTDRLRTQVVLSVVLAVIAGVAGYILGAFGPEWVGGRHAVSVTGMMTVVSGCLLGAVVVASPSHGVLARLAATRLAVTVAREDLLATLYRAEERRAAPGRCRPDSPVGWRAGPPSGATVLVGPPVVLTERGRSARGDCPDASALGELPGVGSRPAPDHVHDTAMRWSTSAMGGRVRSRRRAGPASIRTGRRSRRRRRTAAGTPAGVPDAIAVAEVGLWRRTPHAG